MKTKLVVPIILGMLVLSLALASAETTETKKEGSFINSFLFQFKKIGLFTAAGQERSCDTNARDTLPVQTGDTYTKSGILGFCSGSPSALINVFTSDWKFIEEIRVEDIGSGLKAGGNQIWEIYCCPYSACSSNSGCSSSPASNYGNICNINYGSCYGTTPTHQTKVYKCVNNQWVFQKNANFGEENFCSSSLNNNYIRASDTIGGCYSSPPDGWCGSGGTEKCPLSETFGQCTTLGQKKCDSGYKTLECVSYNSNYCWRLKDICTPGCQEGCEYGNNESNGTEEGGDSGGGGDIQCKEEESVFYTDAEIRTDKDIRILVVGIISQDRQATASQLEKYIPGFSNKFIEVKSEACCSGLKPVFDEEKTLDFSDDYGILGILTYGKSAKGTYSVYKCVSKENLGFCLNMAHSLLNPIIHTDDCQTNTIIFIVIILVGVIALARFMG